MAPRVARHHICGVLHPVALENSCAAFAQSASMLLQALLNGPVVAQLLATKALRIPRARLLLLRRAEMALGQGNRASGYQEEGGENDRTHEWTSLWLPCQRLDRAIVLSDPRHDFMI